MKRQLTKIAACVALGVALSWGASVNLSVAGGADSGAKLFIDNRCSTCHSVEAASIEAKTKSEKMKGEDLSGYVWEGEFADLAAYLRKESEQDGEKHKSAYKGSDEQLKTMMDWLASLETPADD